MLRILYYFLFFGSVAVHAQEPKVAFYWQQINKAELSICKARYVEAVEIYKSTFLLDTSMGDPIDFYNASVCGILTEDFNFAQECMLRLVEAGFDFTFFSKKHTFKRFRESKYWLIFVDKYPHSRLCYLRHFDVKQKVSLERLFFEDQHLRSVRSGDQLEYNGRDFDVTVDTIIKYDLLLCSETLGHLKKFGFPCARTGELYTVQDTNILLHYMFELVFHSYLRECPDFTENLLPHLIVGQIRPELFWSWYSYEINQKGSSVYGPTSTFMILNGQPFIEKYNSAKTELYNHKRSELFLPSMADERKKVSCKKLMLIPSDFIICPFETNDILNGLSIEEVEFMKPVLKEVNYHDFIDE